jgi:hypothetical protein
LIVLNFGFTLLLVVLTFDSALAKGSTSARGKSFYSERDPVYEHLACLQEAAYRDPWPERWKDEIKSPAFREFLLQALQRKREADIPDDYSILSRNQLKTLVQKNPETAITLAFGLTTPFESPFFYSHMEQLWLWIGTAAEKLELGKGPAPKFGTLPTAWPNAITIPVPDSKELLIVINPDMFDFTYLLTKTLLDTINPSYEPEMEKLTLVFSPENLRERLKGDPSLKKQFLNTILGFITGKQIETERRDRGKELLRRYITEGMEFFLFGHEYIHVIKKHAAEGEETLFMVPSDLPLFCGETVVVRNLVRSWSNELTADLDGVLLMSNSVDLRRAGYFRLHGELVKSGASLLMGMLQILDEAKYILAKGVQRTPASSEEIEKMNRLKMCIMDSSLPIKHSCDMHVQKGQTHPPAWLRQELITSALSNMRPTGMSQEEERFYALSQALDQTMKILWKETVKDLEALRKNNPRIKTQLGRFGH